MALCLPTIYFEIPFINFSKNQQLQTKIQQCGNAWQSRVPPPQPSLPSITHGKAELHHAQPLLPSITHTHTLPSITHGKAELHHAQPSLPSITHTHGVSLILVFQIKKKKKKNWIWCLKLQ